MTLDSKALWQSLGSFSLDDPSHAVPFSARLRREQGWTAAYTSRVLDEYRRFLFLTATHEELIVPSEDVDQAWHLHMLDTRSYWDELCWRVVRCPIHHTPSRGGDDEDVRHLDAYEATLRRYRETFGEAPPADIWPDAHERFAGRYRRIDTRDVWLVPKRFVRHGAVATAAMAVLAGCANAINSAMNVLLILGILVSIIGALVWAAQQARVNNKDESRRGGGCGAGGVSGCGCDGGGGGCGGGGCGGGGCG
jgi:hypothetical protein